MITLTLSNKEALEALFAVLVPMLISWLKACAWSHQAKALLALLVSGLAGAVTVAAAGQLDVQHWLQTAGIILAASQAFYALYFKETEFNTWLEQKTVL